MMDKSGWKALAIAMIVIYAFSIAFFAFLLHIGTQEIAAEEHCEFVTCEGYASWQYVDGMCGCYQVAGDEMRLIKTEYIE
jgi:hypothetical protein